MRLDPGGRPLEILLVEDSWSDIGLTLVALDEGDLQHNTDVIRFGDDVLPYLRQQGWYSCAPRPDLILLDLGLPGKDGRQVLVEIKTDEQLATIPLVIMTESAAVPDVMRGREMAMDAYLTKPVQWKNFIDLVKTFKHQWPQDVSLPAGV